MKLKNKFIKRFSAVFCACMIACLSFLAVIGFSPQTEKISASAETLEQAQAETKYYLKIPAGTTFGFSQVYPLDLDITDYSMYLSLSMFLCSSFDNSAFLTWCSINIVDINSFSYEDYSLLSPVMFVSLSSDLSSFTVVYDYYLYYSDTLVFDFFYSDVCSLICEFSIDSGSDKLGEIYYRPSSPTVNDTYLAFEVVEINNSGGASQEELDQAFNNGYTQGQIVGKIEGVQQGVDQVSVNTASKNIFESSAVRNLVNVSTGQSTDIQLAFEPFKLSYYPDTPIYRLYSPNTSSFPDGIYRVTIAFSPYINYTKDDEVPIDELKISTDYVVENSFNDFSFISDIRGTVGDISSTVTAYDMQIVDSNYVYSVDSLGDYKAFSFGSTDIADTPYLEVLSFNIDTSKISGDTIAYFSTEELMSAYNGAYKDGYEVGETDGFGAGRAEGYTNGFENGYRNGEMVGYSDGVEAAHTYTFLNLITAVIDAPVKTMLGLLDFEILGMDMQKFFLSILTAALIIAAYRLFSGGTA